MDLFVRRRELMMMGGGGGYIKDGLALHLDGINKGTTDTTKWVDLVGGVEFVEANGQDCHGIDRIICSKVNYLLGPTDLVFPVNTCTIECAVNLTKLSWGGIFVLSNSNTYILTDADHHIANDNKYKYLSSLDYFRGGIATISFAKDVAVENGVLMQILNGGWNSGNSRKASIGCLGENGSYSLNGDIYAIRIYNRLLTTDEMIHNQRVDNERFGLGLTI